MAGNEEKKIIRVLHLIEHLDVGGAERAAVDIIKSLDPKLIHSLCCVYRHKGAFGQELEQQGYPLYCLKKSFISDKLECFSSHAGWLGNVLVMPIVLLESIAFVIRLTGFIRTKKIDIVHSHLYSANFWGRVCALLAGRQARSITTEHNTSDYNPSWKVNLGNRLLAPCATRIVAVSKTVADSLIAMHWVKPAQLEIIPNGVMLDSQPQTSAGQTDISLPGDGVRIAIIAYLWPVKRHDLLFQAVNLLRQQGRQLTCLVIGDGPERNRLEKMVTDLNLGDSVTMLGERYDVTALLPHIDIVVSTSDTEGLPVNLLEALAAGVAVVATDAGGTAEIIHDHDTGLLVEPGNARAIADSISALMDDKALAHRLGENGRQLVQKSYTREHIARQWQKLYSKLIPIANNHRL